MLSGHLREKNNTYYAVLNCKHSDGKRYSKWVSTGIAVKKGNKRTAEKKLEEFCSTYNEYRKTPMRDPGDAARHKAHDSRQDFLGHPLLRLYAYMAILCRNRGRSCHIQWILQLCRQRISTPVSRKPVSSCLNWSQYTCANFTGTSEKAIQRTDKSQKRERLLRTIMPVFTRL